MSSLNRVFSAMCLVSLLAVVVYDARQHIDPKVIALKQARKSPQQHWHAFYGQKNVYFDASFRYADDFEALRHIIEPDAVVLSDLSTSYYVASHLPVYVPNVHRHHKRRWLPQWYTLLESRDLCSLDVPARRHNFSQFIKRGAGAIESLGAYFKYVIVNKDQLNSNMRNDCMSQTRTAFVQNIGDLAEVVFDGEYLRLYRISRD